MRKFTKYLPNTVNLSYQGSVILKTVVLPILISLVSESILTDYLKMVAFGFMYYCFVDFGTFAAISNRLAKNKKIPLNGLLHPCLGVSICLIFSHQVADFIKISEHLIVPFLLYYFANSSFTYLSGIKRSKGSYDSYLKVSMILNIVEFISFFILMYVGFTFSSLIIIVAVLRLGSILALVNIFAVHCLVLDFNLNRMSANLGFAGVTNAFNNQGALLVLNMFGLTTEMSTLYFMRLFLRPFPLVLRYFSDRSLSKYGSLNFEDALRLVLDDFKTTKFNSILALTSIFSIIAFVNAITGDFESIIFMSILSIEMLFIILRTPYEVALLSFENLQFKGITYFLVYNVGLVFLCFLWVDRPALVYVLISSAFSSFAVFLWLQKLTVSKI